MTIMHIDPTRKFRLHFAADKHSSITAITKIEKSTNWPLFDTNHACYFWCQIWVFNSRIVSVYYCYVIYCLLFTRLVTEYNDYMWFCAGQALSLDKLEFCWNCTLQIDCNRDIDWNDKISILVVTISTIQWGIIWDLIMMKYIYKPRTINDVDLDEKRQQKETLTDLPGPVF